MRVIPQIPVRAIDRFGSSGFEHARLAAGAIQVSVAQLDGVVGGHEAVAAQLLVVLDGRVQAATHVERAELGPLQAALRGEGEWHEIRSLEPALLLLVEGDISPFV